MRETKKIILLLKQDSITWRQIFLCHYSIGINSFKTFMAYKDVFMLTDEEVKVTCRMFKFMMSIADLVKLYVVHRTCRGESFPIYFGINLLVFYFECCSLIGYATHYLSCCRK